MKTRDHAQMQDANDATAGRARFYVTERLGPKQSMTPEGFLLCEEVPAARTGVMVYGGSELPMLTPGENGMILVERDSAALFNPDTVASLNGKSFTDDHPSEDVLPENWQSYEVGAVFNPRRGGQGQDDLLFVDVLIKDPKAIERVRDGKVEVSCGYDADYEEIAPGKARQLNIVFNHLALVDEGRCGPRCAIRDRKTVKQENEDMKTRDAAMRRSKVSDAVTAALKKLGIKVRDEDVTKLGEHVADELGAGGEPSALEDNDTHVHIHMPGGDELGTGGAAEGVQTFDDEAIRAHIEQNASEHAAMVQRIEALEAALAAASGGAADEASQAEEQALEQASLDEVPEELKEKAKETKDSVYLGDSFRETVAGAEILSPGIGFPTYDAAAKKADTMKAVCGLRRKALDAAYTDPAMKAFIDGTTGKRTFDSKSMTCDAARVLFRSAVAHKATLNNVSATRTNDNVAPSAPVGRITSPAEWNKANRARYGRDK